MQNNSNEPNATLEPSNANLKTVDISAPGVAKQIAARVLKEIDNYCDRTYNDGHRKHLGASLIGHDCKRYLWYTFRWVLKQPPDGRLQRLFNRGHREEERFIEWLEGIGCKVWTHQPEVLHFHPESDCYFIGPEFDPGDGLCENVTADPMHVAIAASRGVKFKRQQFRVSGVGGHFGGSLDAIIEFPPSWGITKPVLGEFKTNGTGKGFNELLATGMAVTKAQHFAQTSVYGNDPNYKFEWVLYLNINKNDDSIHVELVKLDWNLGQQMLVKAEKVITSQEPPPRLSMDQTFWKCKGCTFAGICHDHQSAEVNCRSCKNAQPIDNGQWQCNLPAHSGAGPIPDEVIKVGCSSYQDITLVHD